MQRKRLGDTLVLLSVAAIAAVTLFPSDATSPGGDVFCLFCGWRQVADFVLNVILFVPLGAALCFRLGGRLKPVIIVALLTLLIEILQIPIPGRDANLRDLIANTLGGAVGMMMFRTAPVWLGASRAVGRGWSLSALAAALAVLTAGALMLAPSFPDTVYYGQWTARFGNMQPYHGRVLSATIGDIAVPSRRSRHSDSLQTMLRGGTPIHIRFRVGPATTGLAPIFSIYDEFQHEILMIGADRGDGVYRFRTAGIPLFDQPDVRLRGAMNQLTRGDVSRIVIWRRGRSLCMTVGHTQSCNLGYTVGRTWSLLLFDERLGAAPLRIADMFWIALLFFPAGVWWRNRRAVTLKLATAMIGLAIIPFATGVLHSSVFEYAGAVLGILTGGLAGKTLARLSVLQGSASQSLRTHRSMRS